MSEGGSVRLPFVMIGRHGVKRAFTQPCDDESVRVTSPPRSGCRTNSTTRSARSRRPDCPWRRGPAVSDTDGFSGGRARRPAWCQQASAPWSSAALPAAAARLRLASTLSASTAACWRWHRPRCRSRPCGRGWRRIRHPAAAGAALATRVGGLGGSRRWRRNKLRRFRRARQQILRGCGRPAPGAD